MENLDAEGFNADSRHTIKMFSGKYVDPWTMTESDVDIVDIATSNSNECRFNGHTDPFWSVAQHEILTSALVASVKHRELSLAALVHDGGEAYSKDLPSPIKNHPLMAVYKAMADRCQRVVYRSTLGSVPSANEHVLIKQADIFARRVEQIAFMKSGISVDVTGSKFDYEFARAMVHSLATQSPPAIKQRFLELYGKLSGGRFTNPKVWRPS